MTRSATVSSHVDLRAFNYPLAPYVRQQQWHMDALQTRLAQALKAVADAQAALDALRALLGTQAQQIQHNLNTRPDPASHRRGLAFLAQLQHRIGAQVQQLQMLQAQRESLQADCIAQQRKLDGLAEHRAQAIDEYAAEATRRELAEADRDWIGRLHRQAKAAQRVDGAAP